MAGMAVGSSVGVHFIASVGGGCRRGRDMSPVAGARQTGRAKAAMGLDLTIQEEDKGQSTNSHGSCGAVVGGY
jgi:hypothetical protein